MGHFLGRPKAPQGNPASNALEHGVGDGVRHGRGNKAGQDGIDAHAAACRFLGQTSRQTQDATLAGGVIALSEIALLGNDGTHVDDAAAAAAAADAAIIFVNGRRVFQKTLASVKGSFQIDVHHLIPVGFFEITNKVIARNTRATDQNGGFLGTFTHHDRFHLRAVRHVARDHIRMITATVATAVFVVVSIMTMTMTIQPEDPFAARPFQFESHGFANARRGSRHNGDTIRELQPGHCCLAS